MTYEYLVIIESTDLFGDIKGIYIYISTSYTYDIYIESASLRV